MSDDIHNECTCNPLFHFHADLLVDYVCSPVKYRDDLYSKHNVKYRCRNCGYHEIPLKLMNGLMTSDLNIVYAPHQVHIDVIVVLLLVAMIVVVLFFIIIFIIKVIVLGLFFNIYTLVPSS